MVFLCLKMESGGYILRRRKNQTNGRMACRVSRSLKPLCHGDQPTRSSSARGIDSFHIMWWPWKPVQLDGHLDWLHFDTSWSLNNCTCSCMKQWIDSFRSRGIKMESIKWPSNCTGFYGHHVSETRLYRHYDGNLTTQGTVSTLLRSASFDKLSGIEWFWRTMTSGTPQMPPDWGFAE